MLTTMTGTGVTKTFPQREENDKHANFSAGDGGWCHRKIEGVAKQQCMYMHTMVRTVTSIF